MNVTYETVITSVCPVDINVTDVYDLKVIATGCFIPVEDILEAISKITSQRKPIFQEHLTELLSGYLSNGGKLDVVVETTGIHSGIRTITTA